MRRVFSTVVIIVLCFTFTACGFRKAGPDPLPGYPYSEYTIEAPLKGISRLMMTETTFLKDTSQLHTYQYYEYDKQGRLTRIYAPEGYLAYLSDIPRIWDLYEHGEIREVEEDYEYNGEHLVRIKAYLPTELAQGNNVSYTIEFEYDGDILRGEILTIKDLEYRITFEYEDSRIVRAISVDGGAVNYSYGQDGQLSMKTIVDAEGNVNSELYDYEDTKVLFQGYYGDLNAPVTDIDGRELRIISENGQKPHHEIRQYDLEGRILYLAREYEDDTVRFSNFYYSKAE